MDAQCFDYAATTAFTRGAAAMQSFDSIFTMLLRCMPLRENRLAGRSLRRRKPGVPKPTEIVFTAGGTEANNIAIHGVMQAYPDATLVVSAVEHDAVLEPAKQYTNRVIPVTEQGIIKTDELQALIDDSVALISVIFM